MSKFKYVPIITWKRGEQVALRNLDDRIKSNIIPLIEIPYTKGNQDIAASLNANWDNRIYYFYLKPQWYEEDEDAGFDIFYQKFDECCSDNAIPVFHLSNSFALTNKRSFKNGIAIRVQHNEFGLLESTLNSLIKSKEVIPETTDILFDLRYVKNEDVFTKSTLIKAAVSDIDQISKFRSIIIASCSFPSSFVNLQPERIYKFQRYEIDIDIVAAKLSERFGFNYIYSDYGPTDLEEVEYVLGMSPNFKIKYTILSEYVYIKGIQIKKGGLDLENVKRCCKVLIDSEEYLGKDYSWADKQIYDIANGKAPSGGNLTNWVSYNYNHHITLVTKQL